jgi:hypothetical protein
MATLQALLTLYADAETLGDVQAWYAQCQKFNLDESTPVTDGANAKVAGLDRVIGTYPGVCLADVATWLAATQAAEISPDAPMTKPALDLAVDLPIQGTELAGCGECVEPTVDVIVHLHDTCSSTWVPIDS